MKIYLVLPVYNESSPLLKSLLKKISNHLPLSRVIVVDDGSTRSLQLPPPLHLLRHDINLGKGAALKTGIHYAFKQGADAIILMDSDGQHDPKEIPLFVRLLSSYDVVFGSRRPSLHTPLVRLLGNKFASIYVNLLFGIYLSDILSGYRALTKSAYRLLRWSSARYGVETEMIIRLSHHKQLRFIEIPIDTIYLDYYKGVTILHGIRIFFNSLWWKLFWAFK